MGKVLSSLAIRPLKNFNVENRAEKVITKQIPRTAPRHPTSQKYIDECIKDHPDFVKTQKEKPEQLLEYLKSVKVVSHTEKGLEGTSGPSRQLPQERRAVSNPEYGYHEPAVVPLGKVTLKQALHFLTNHQQDKKTWNAQLIAKEYNLDVGLVQKILKHFRAFNVYIPSEKLKEAKKKGLLSAEQLQNLMTKMQVEKPSKDSIPKLPGDEKPQ